MPRAYVYKVLTSTAGDVILDASVQICEHGTTTPIAVSMFSAPSGGATVPNPFNATTGVIEFYLDKPRRVTVVISRSGVDSVAFQTVDVIVPEDPEPSPIEAVSTVNNSGPALTLVPTAQATIHNVTLNANAVALTFPTLTSGVSFELLLTQDAVGARTVTWPVTVRWPNRTEPTLTAIPGRRDFFRFYAIGSEWFATTIQLNY